MTKPLVIGIAGGTGSGKSTVARKVAEDLTAGGAAASVAFVDMDAYYRNFGHLALAERRRVNWDHPDAFDIDLFVEHLDRLAARRGDREAGLRLRRAPARIGDRADRTGRRRRHRRHPALRRCRGCASCAT